MNYEIKEVSNKKARITLIIGLSIVIIILIFILIMNNHKYDKYNVYSTDNKKYGEVMHYSKENDSSYISLYYPETENKKLNKIIADYYHSIIKGKNGDSQKVVYMDYSIEKQFKQYLNLEFQVKKFNDKDKVVKTENKIMSYDLKNDTLLTVEDCLRNNYQSLLSGVNGIENINPDNNMIKVDKDKFVIYSDDKLKNKVEIDYQSNKDLIRLANKNIPSNAPLDVKKPQAQPKFDPSKKMIAITLDDGPHKTNTLKTIGLFEKYNGRATFLMLGKNVKFYPEIVKTVYEHGFEIGSHTWDHPDLRKLDAENVNKQILNTQDEIFKITGFEPKVIRPPFGATNDLAKDVIHKNGLEIALWNLDTEDWKLKDANKIKDKIVNNAFDGAVILVHDIHNFTIDGLEMALEELSNRGYQFVTLDTLKNHRELKNVIR